jgi:hypothetical protein
MSGKSIDYSSTPVSFYKFVCKNPDILFSYLGHTTNYIKRKSDHKSHCSNSKDKAHKIPLYVFMRKNGGFENWNMIVIHTQICKNKRDAERIETELMEQQQFKLNAMKAYVSEEQHKEQIAKYAVEYYEQHKEQVAEYNKQHKEQKAKYDVEYRQNNKEQITICNNEYYKLNRDVINAKQRAKYALKKAQMLCQILDATNP